MKAVIFANIAQYPYQQPLNDQHILISRTDAIGDVVLALPLCGFLKKTFPGVTISFLGRTYTRPVIDCCSSVDHFVNYDDLLALDEPGQVNYLRAVQADVIVHVFPVPLLAKLAKGAGIRMRIGTRSRMYHWLTCNKLVGLSRRNSMLHEAELNFSLLRPLYAGPFPPAAELFRYYDFTHTAVLPKEIRGLLDPVKFNLVLHPMSHGSGKEWSLDRYAELVGLLPGDEFRIFISGSEKEQPVLSEWIATLPPEKDLHNLSGQLTLGQLIAFYHLADGLIASGTGPLHLAAASGINTLGLFPATRPIHPGRWAPLGSKSTFLVSDDDSLDSVSAADLYRIIASWKKN